MTSSIASSTLEGRLSLPLLYLANTIADSDRFRTVCSAADRNGALGHIYLGGAGESESPPICVIRHLNGALTERLGTTNWSGSGPLRMFFIFPHPSGITDWNDAYARISNDAGMILYEMQNLIRPNPGIGPYLDIANISLDAIGQWDKDEEGADHWEVEFTVFWRGM